MMNQGSGKAPATDAGTKRRCFEDIAASMLTRGGLLEQAEAILKRAVEADPDNLAAIRKLATIYRCRGDLVAASDAYRRIGVLQPDDVRAHHLHSVLGGHHPLPQAVAQGEWPAPFVKIEDFLSRAEHDLVLELALARQEELEVATIGDLHKYNTGEAIVLGAVQRWMTSSPGSGRGSSLPCRTCCPSCSTPSRSVRSSFR